MILALYLSDICKVLNVADRSFGAIRKELDTRVVGGEGEPIKIGLSFI